MRGTWFDYCTGMGGLTGSRISGMEPSDKVITSTKGPVVINCNVIHVHVTSARVSTRGVTSGNVSNWCRGIVV